MKAHKRSSIEKLIEVRLSDNFRTTVRFSPIHIAQRERLATHFNCGLSDAIIIAIQLIYGDDKSPLETIDEVAHEYSTTRSEVIRQSVSQAYGAVVFRAKS